MGDRQRQVTRLSSRLVPALLIASLTTAACAAAPTEPTTTGLLEQLSVLPTTPPPELDEGTVAWGADLYAVNCASCHGVDLRGAEQWKTPLDNGTYPPPPMDGSGHTWHHPDRVLTDIIRGDRSYQSTMPKFTSLTDDEIAAILAYFKAAWGADERMYQWQMTQRDAALGSS